MPLSFNPDKELPDINGKVVLITGGTAGVGASSILQLAKHHPSKIYFTGRDETRGESIVADVKSTAPDVEISFLKADLTSLEPVKAVFDQFTSDRLDILMCNAGIMANSPILSKDGYEPGQNLFVYFQLKARCDIFSISDNGSWRKELWRV